MPIQTTTIDVGVDEKQAWPGKEKGWPPVDLDGWVMIHCSLIRNLKDWECALAGARDRIASIKLDGKHASWIALNLATWWSMHAHSMHDHHDAEEKIFFPAFAQKFALPARFTESHAVLTDEMAAMESALVKLLEAANCTKVETPPKSPFGDDGPLLGWAHNGGEAQRDKMLDALQELQSIHSRCARASLFEPRRPTETQPFLTAIPA